MEQKKNQYYVTRGVNQLVSPPVIALMIEMAMEVEDKDYLQVFRVIAKDGFSVIKLTQEVPDYEKSVKISWIPEHSLKLFLMNNTLLLSSEY